MAFQSSSSSSRAQCDADDDDDDDGAIRAELAALPVATPSEQQYAALCRRLIQSASDWRAKAKANLPSVAVTPAGSADSLVDPTAGATPQRGPAALIQPPAGSPSAAASSPPSPPPSAPFSFVAAASLRCRWCPEPGRAFVTHLFPVYAFTETIDPDDLPLCHCHMALFSTMLSSKEDEYSAQLPPPDVAELQR